MDELYEKLSEVDGVDVINRSDCGERGEITMRVGNDSYRLRVCSGRKLAVHEPINPRHYGDKKFEQTRRGVELILKEYHHDVMIEDFDAVGFSDSFFNSN